MKKKDDVHVVVIFMLLVLLAVSSWLFARGVGRELRMNSIEVIKENTRQGANTVNIQMAKDFAELSRIKKALAAADPDQLKERTALCGIMEPDVVVYLPDSGPMPGGTQAPAEAAQGGPQVYPYNSVRLDETARNFLDHTDLERGIIDSYVSSITGENIFHIFERIPLAETGIGYLVKEYRAKEIAEQFTLTFYDYTGFSYLVNQTGRIMVRSRHRNSNKTISSLYETISEEENDPDQLEMLKENIYELQSGWAEFTDEGVGLIFCYEPLRSDSNWLLVSVVPEYVITGQAKSILQKTMVFAGMVVVIVFLIAAAFHGMKMRESKAHTIELCAALDAADAANKVRGQFLMNMSHDIRTPLNAIIGMTVIARDSADDKKKMQECLKKINRSGKHLLSLVNDVLDMSQISDGKMILKEDNINFARLYAEVADLMGAMAKEAGIVMDSAPVRLENEMVSADPVRIRQIFTNIINNAIKYTKPGGHVRLELSQIGGIEDENAVYCFCCTDTGIGMEKDFLEKIFQSFERHKNTTASGIAGIGVGLAITKGLLDLMGGSIVIESEPGRGSVVTVSLPLKICEAPQQAVQGSPGLNEQQAGHGASSDAGAADECSCSFADKRILLVEDVELNMEIAEAMLSTTGVQIEKAYNGQEAVQMVREKPCGYYDLIFMDIQMPVMDGYEATRQIRRMDRQDAGKIPIVALSANALAQDVENSKDAGMNGHLAKPIDMDPIENVMRQYLS